VTKGRLRQRHIQALPPTYPQQHIKNSPNPYAITLCGLINI
jgi:hypothetical protein